ncbi:hypothetical protein GHT06_022600 [Daphnia sinensis]|uniref:Uncharacterized protein n=1 Tax=Daphnia sinensis TaxID=1820382 RepID=A0AAD5PR86_9CRUS|nr:hypothetical protein GHT06_022600 [Daphnia sinensis]
MADERCFAQADAVINSSTREQDNQVEHSKNRGKGIKNVGVSTPCYPPYGAKEPVFFSLFKSNWSRQMRTHHMFYPPTVQ